MEITDIALLAKMLGSSGGGGECSVQAELAETKAMLDGLLSSTATEIVSDCNVLDSKCFQAAYAGKFASLKKVTLSKATKLESESFKYLSSLEEINIPMVERVGVQAFSNLPALKHIVLESATYFGFYAFNACSNLEVIDTHKNWASDGENSLVTSCPKLKALILRSETYVPNGKYTKAFGSASTIGTGTGYIYVPRVLLNAYKTSTDNSSTGENGWSEFANQFRALEDYTVDGTITGELDETKI